MLIFEEGRRWSPTVNRFVVFLMGPLLRKHEVGQRSGSFYFITGCLVSILAFHKSIATISILYLSIGDPLASMVGILLRHHSQFRFHRRSGKSLLGTMAMTGACSLITYMLLAENYPSHDFWLITICISGGLSGGISELLSPYPIAVDDNFLIPVISSCALWFVFHVTGVDVQRLLLPDFIKVTLPPWWRS